MIQNRLSNRQLIINGNKEFVLFSGCPNAVIARNESKSMNFFEIKTKTDISNEKPISNPFSDKTLVYDLKDEKFKNFIFSKYFPVPYFLATGTFFAMSPPGKKIEDCFIKYIPFLGGDLKIKIPNRAKGQENIVIAMDISDFSIVPDRNYKGDFILYVSDLTKIVWHHVPEEEYGICPIDIRTGIPNPQVLRKYKGPNRQFLRGVSDEFQIGLVVRDTSYTNFDMIYLEDNVSQEKDELKRYKTIWVQK